MKDANDRLIGVTGEPAETSTHMSGRMSAQSQRIEVITRGERRRRWSVEEKQAIVAESLEPGASITAIARRHGIGTGQLYGWRHQFLGDRPGGSMQFARVELIREPHRLSAPVTAASDKLSGQIEIVLPGGISVRVGTQVDGQALRRVLAALRG